MKKLSLAISLLFLVMNLSAQLSIGLKATSPTFSSDKIYKEFYNRDIGVLHGLSYLSTRTSYSYGLSFHSEFKPGWLTVDLMYRKRSVQYRVGSQPSTKRSINYMEDNFKELSVPVLAGIRKNNFKIGLGPVFNFKLKSEYGLAGLSGFTVHQRNINTGFQFMFGYVINDRFHIDLKRELSFNQSGEEYKSMNKFINLNNLPKSTSLSIGMFF